MLKRLTVVMSVTGLLVMALIGQASPAAAAGSNFNCTNNGAVQVQVVCLGQVSVLPVTITVSNVRALNGNEINVLSNDLNNLSIKDVNVLDANKILNDVNVTVLNDFLNKFNINVNKNDVTVCANVAGHQV